SVVVDAYERDIINGFEKDRPLYNAANPERTQSSAHVDLKDPIQIHLLTETALSDSKEYEILSQEEIDGLKKQCQLITQRIESTRSNLLIQAKYRDAAVSMVRLYSPTLKGDQDGNMASSAEDDARREEAEAEREACERKCEDLAAELFHLEKRIMEPKRRLLEHTAGVLQLTHRGPGRGRRGGPDGQPANGVVPGSPESMYTYNQSRNSLDGPDDFYTDDTSFTGIEPIDTRGPRKNPLEIPLKSPNRENSNMREMDRLRDENRVLMDAVAEMEAKLEGLNGSLRETIVRFNPEGNSEFEGPPTASQFALDQLKPGQMLRNQVEYLESGLVAVQAEQETHLESRSLGLGLGIGGGGGGGGSSVTEQELQSLWDVIQNGYAAIKTQKEDRRRARADKGLEDDESDDEGIDLSETYSLANFSSRVRWLYRQATVLKDQRAVLRRQIKQQRELNNKSDAEKDAELAQKQEDLDQSEREVGEAQRMLSEALEDLERAREDALRANAAAAAAADATTSSSSADADKMHALEEKMGLMQRELDETSGASEDMRRRLAQVDASIGNLSGQLDEALTSRDAAAAEAEQLRIDVENLREEIAQKTEALQAQERENETLSLTCAELKTEVTLARAELDSAYGSRAERAKDLAAAQSHSEADRLREELTRTVMDLEKVTKETIASERERLDIEVKLDDALAARSELQADLASLRERLDEEVTRSRDKIAQLQEQLDTEKLHAGRGGTGRPGAGAAVLSEQFRAHMREERKKYQEDMKEERARYRKLEEELGRIRRAQGP
ncbi:involucrin repeat protein, partial [Geosmithia morbida]